MSERIPEDLSHLPDFHRKGAAAAPVQTDEPVPEDLSRLPDAPPEADAPEAPAAARARRTRPRQGLRLYPQAVPGDTQNT